MKLISDKELADDFGITVELLHKLRKRNRWPCVKLGRYDYRFTEEQVAEIVAQQTDRPPEPFVSDRPLPGQTARSAAYHRRP